MSLSGASHTIEIAQQSIPMIPVENQLQLENMMQDQITLSSMTTGKNWSNNPSPTGAPASQPMKEINSAKTLSSLKSNAKPQEILEKQPEPRLLRVSKEDIEGLCQVLREYKEILMYK
jgi:hypothetical protein